MRKRWRGERRKKGDSRVGKERGTEEERVGDGKRQRRIGGLERRRRRKGRGEAGEEGGWEEVGGGGGERGGRRRLLEGREREREKVR